MGKYAIGLHTHRHTSTNTNRLILDDEDTEGLNFEQFTPLTLGLPYWKRYEHYWKARTSFIRGVKAYQNTLLGDIHYGNTFRDEKKNNQNTNFSFVPFFSFSLLTFLTGNGKELVLKAPSRSFSSHMDTQAYRHISPVPGPVETPTLKNPRQSDFEFSINIKCDH